MDAVSWLTMTDAVVFSFACRNEDATAINVDNDTRIQILDSMPDLLRGDKEQCIAFIVSLHSSIMSWLPRAIISRPLFPNLKHGY